MAGVGALTLMRAATSAESRSPRRPEWREGSADQSLRRGEDSAISDEGSEVCGRNSRWPARAPLREGRHGVSPCTIRRPRRQR
jgi:hypothetical protein